MPYIGRGPSKSGAFRIIDDISGDFNGVLTSFALEVGSAALTVGLPETLLIAVDGVIQEPGSAYTISGSNIVFGAPPLAEATFWGVEHGDVGGLADNIVDGKITTAKLASGVLDTDISSVSGSDDTLASAKSIKTYVDAQVTANNLDITDGSTTIEIDANSEALTITSGEGIDATVSGNALTIAGEDATTSNKGVASFNTVNFLVSSGDVTIKDNGVRAAELYTTSGTAGSDTFLRGDETWAAAGGGSLTFINTETADNSSVTLTVTGLSTAYDSYLIALSDMVPADNKDLRFMIGDSSGIHSNSTDYECHTQTVASTSTSYSSIANTSIGFIPLGSDVGNNAGDGLSALLVLNNANSSTMRPTISGTVAYLTDSENVVGGSVVGQRKAVIAVTQVQIKFSTGNIVRGRMTVWGLAHA